MEKVGTFKGVVIYQYDFTNKQNVKIKTAKVLFNIMNTAIYVNTTKLTDKKIGQEVLIDLAYDGSKWVVL